MSDSAFAAAGGPALPAQLTQVEASACLNVLQTALDAATGTDAFVVDAGPLVRFDSAALAVLLALRRACRRKGVPLQVNAWPPHLQELAQMYGVAALFAHAA